MTASTGWPAVLPEQVQHGELDGAPGRRVRVDLFRVRRDPGFEAGAVVHRRSHVRLVPVEEGLRRLDGLAGDVRPRARLAVPDEALGGFGAHPHAERLGALRRCVAKGDLERNVQRLELQARDRRSGAHRSTCSSRPTARSFLYCSTGGLNWTSRCPARDRRRLVRLGRARLEPRDRERAEAAASPLGGVLDVQLAQAPIDRHTDGLAVG